MIVSDVIGIKKLEYNVSKEDKRIYIELLVDVDHIGIYDIVKHECDTIYLRISFNGYIYMGQWKVYSIRKYENKYIVGLLSMETIKIVNIREWR